MAQVSPQYCPRCGTEVIPGQNFCATCGLPAGGQQKVEQMASSASGPARPILANEAQALRPRSQASRIAVLDPQPAPGKRRPGPTGIALLLFALLLVLIALGYTLLQVFGVGKPVQAPITKTTINTHLTYASIDMTILNVQQAQNFLDDPRTASNGMARIQIQAKNTTQQPIALAYTETVHLLLPGGKEASALYASANSAIAPGATQTSVIDFALPGNLKVNQLNLRLGRSSEAQMDIPLNGHADENIYAARTIKIDKKLVYLNMDWMLIDASSQLSFDGQQANKGMRYITLTVSVDNPLTETVIPGSPFTYMRLKVANDDNSPLYANVPVAFEPGVTGKTGSVTFQVPQESTSFTLTLSASGKSGFDPATTKFQL